MNRHQAHLVDSKPDGKLARRQRMRLAAGLLLAVAMAAVLAFSLVPMRVKAVAVSGAKLLSRNEVIRIAAVPPGKPVGWGTTREIEERLMRHPAFSSARVTRGFDGTLGISLVERMPVAWLASHGCAVSADGTLLTYLTRREESWPPVVGVEIRDGRVTDLGAVGAASAGYDRLRELAGEGSGVLRRVGPNAGAWEWDVDGKQVVFSSPVREEEIKRLQRFRREFPRAWGKARTVDLRFAERVVIKK